VLFAVTERSVLHDHVVIDDADRQTEFFVVGRRDLAVKIQLHSLDTCAVVYTAPAGGARGLTGFHPDTASPGKDAAAVK
jgi:hypothetical protein